MPALPIAPEPSPSASVKNSVQPCALSSSVWPLQSSSTPLPHFSWAGVLAPHALRPSLWQVRVPVQVPKALVDAHSVVAPTAIAAGLHAQTLSNLTHCLALAPWPCAFWQP